MVIQVLTALEEVLEAVPGLVEEKHVAVLHELRNVLELVLEYQGGK